MWILFTLIERPYYDRYGSELKSIKGRRNRFGKDEFEGGGWISPDLTGYSVLNQYSKKGELLVEFGQDASDLLKKDKVEKDKSTFRIKIHRRKKVFIPVSEITYNFKDFKAKELTDKNARKLLEAWGYSESPESGVIR